MSHTNAYKIRAIAFCIVIGLGIYSASSSYPSVEPVAEPEPIPVVEISHNYDIPATEYCYVILKYSPEDVIRVAKALYGEARGLPKEEQRLVVWCICNRVDSSYWKDTIEEVVTYEAFNGYSDSNPVVDTLWCTAAEVLTDWSMGKEADVLQPYAANSNYYYFSSSNGHNWYREEW